MAIDNIKAIAINLPQFHPIPENDLWWGKGFTEWRNVTRARPLFKGHYQPHLPSDLGFYDMRLEETLVQQAELAREYGIQGFCYYHYWFNGKRLLNAPLDKIIHTGKPDFPFMLCWANENWSRRWDGMDQEVLMQQNYSERDDVGHIQFLITHFFNDPRYIKVDNKPFILVYRPSLLPDSKATIARWRAEVKAAGFPDLYIGYVQQAGYKVDPIELGFDCAIEFQPDIFMAGKTEAPNIQEKILNKLKIKSSVHYSNYLYSFPKLVDNIIKNDGIRKNVYKAVSPGWDNTARRQGGATIFKDSSPGLYERWLNHAISLTIENKNPGNFLFINAWNEWAEGNHLEPCQKYGRQFLEATQRALNNYI